MVDKILSKKIFAFTLILLMAILVLYLLKDFFTPILVAIILAILTYPIYNYINKKTKKPTLSASLIILIIILLILIPVSILSGLLISQLQNFNYDENQVLMLEEKVNSFAGTSYSFLDLFDQFQEYVKDEATKSFSKIVGFTSNFLLSLFIMFFILFYLLVEKDIFIRELKRFLPFSNNGSKRLIVETNGMIKAILLGQFFTAVVQGILGMISFLIVGINGAIFWGFIMIILSLIPVVGAFIIWVPVGVYLLLEGQIWQGVFVLLWGGLVVSQIDNLIRPKLINRFSSIIHPLETLLGIFAGLALFGFIGIIIGPLIFSLLKILILIYREDYSVKDEN